MSALNAVGIQTAPQTAGESLIINMRRNQGASCIRSLVEDDFDSRHETGRARLPVVPSSRRKKSGFKPLRAASPVSIRETRSNNEMRTAPAPISFRLDSDECAYDDLRSPQHLGCDGL